MDTHDLTAAYALHALDDVQRARYEQHLAQCERCREELAVLTESAAALAWAVDSPAPPEHLRERILDATRRHDNVVALPPRRGWQAIAAVAACLAIGLGVWAGVEHSSLGSRQSLQVVALQGRHGMLVRSSDGTALLVVDKLPAAPAGMTYEAWVIPRGEKPQRAGTFDAGNEMTMFQLGMHVPRGATVAATVEHAGGADQPTSKPLLTAQV